MGIGVSRNEQYENSFIGDFLRVGDELLKSPTSDTIYIIRDRVEFYFVLGEIINEN